MDNSFAGLGFGLFAVLVGTYFWFSFMRRRDRINPEPIKALVYVMLLGGLVSALIAAISNVGLNAVSGGILNDIVQGEQGASFSFILMVIAVSAFIEEIAKSFIAFQLIKRNKEVDEPVDGVIYAVAVGLGFSLFENLVYLVQFGGTVVSMRMLFAVPLHMATGAIWGIYFSRCLSKQTAISYQGTFAYVLAATAFHAAWNASAAALGGLFIVAAPFVMRYCLRRVDREIDGFINATPGAVVNIPPVQEAAPIEAGTLGAAAEPRKAGWLDIAISLLIPWIGMIIGGYAIYKGERNRGAVMIAAGVTVMFVVAFM
jgi:RsiW-degrading membrane proteinase PrsW (M82 family)